MGQGAVHDFINQDWPGSKTKKVEDTGPQEVLRDGRKNPKTAVAARRPARNFLHFFAPMEHEPDENEEASAALTVDDERRCVDEDLQWATDATLAAHKHYMHTLECVVIQGSIAPPLSPLCLSLQKPLHS